MIEGIMAFTIEMIFHHIGHVIDMIKSVRNAPSSSPLKFRTWSWSRGKLVWKWNQPRPVGTRIDAYGVRILFGGKSKSTKSPGAQKFPSPVGGTVSLAQSVLGWANWCCEVLCSITVVAYMKSYYTQVQSLDALSTLLSGLRRWSDQLKANEICRRVIFRPIALVYGAAKFTIGKILSLLMKLVLMLAIVSVSTTSFLKILLASNEVMEEFAQPVGPKIDATVGDKK